MAKRKAKLDLYEIPESQVEITDSPSKEQISFKEKLWGSYIILSFVVLFLIVAGGSWWYFRNFSENLKERTGVSLEFDNSVPKVEHFSVDDLLVSVKDIRDRQYILSCSFTLEVDDGRRELVLGKLEEIRKIIYQTLDDEKDDLISNTFVRKTLKKKLKDNVNRMIGMSCVRDIYITKFLVIS
ncbi:MAG: flagellar basal body-associated FliL family protein [Syntrophales bacterium]|nr:flagellar basal body-associated FliL family protein [Syntrophales bacterium]